MKSVLILTGLLSFAAVNIVAQAPVKKKIEYMVSVEMLSGETKKGILYKVDSAGLQLLPTANNIFRNHRKQETADKGSRWTLSPEQIKSFRIGRKGSTGAALGIGMLIGMTAGSVIGAVTTPKSTCPTNGNLCRSLDGLDRIGNTAGGLFIGA